MDRGVARFPAGVRRIGPDGRADPDAHPGGQAGPEHRPAPDSGPLSSVVADGCAGHLRTSNYLWAGRRAVAVRIAAQCHRNQGALPRRNQGALFVL
ncbi:hypothetical protein GCM10022225_06460 [Plantactinospora mayteni]